jgi:lipopolysaccharide export system protein LptC
MGWRGILTLVLLAAVLVSGWSVWTHRAAEPPGGPASGRSDYQLYDFQLVVLDDQGDESFTLRAPQLARQPGDETLELESPLFLFPGKDAPAGDASGERWEVRSRRGWVSADGDEVRLLGDVRALGPASGGARTMLETERLNVFPQTDLASSDQRVTIVNANSVIRGQGLRVNLATKHYALLSDVESRYVPTR